MSLKHNFVKLVLVLGRQRRLREG